MDEYYARGEKPPNACLHRQSLLLSTTVRTLAQDNYVKLSLSQNKAMAAYMMCAKFVLEDERDAIQGELEHAIRLQEELNSLLEQRYRRRIQVQHMVLYSIQCKVKLQIMLKPIVVKKAAKEQGNKSWKFLSHSTLRTASDDSIHLSDSEDLTELMESELLDNSTFQPESKSRSIDILSLSQHGLSAFLHLDSSSHGRRSSSRMVLAERKSTTSDPRTRSYTTSTSSLISVPETDLSWSDPVNMHYYTEDSFSFAPVDEQLLSLSTGPTFGTLQTTTTS
jgi:Txe/YoeB family toxin of Txe-Axe toxin-antitoxin module